MHSMGLDFSTRGRRKLGVLSAFLKMQGLDGRMAKAYHAALKQEEPA